MKPVEIVLSRGGRKREKKEGLHPTKIYFKHCINITMYPHVQLLYANKII
jgi:hypothetical protein